VNRRAIDIISIIGILLAGLSVCDMLGQWEIGFLNYGYLGTGVGLIVVVTLMLTPRKMHLPFLENCKNGSRFLGLRTAISVLIFGLGWYINAAMNTMYGVGSTQVKDNGIYMLLPLFTMILHITYVGCIKKANKVYLIRGKRL